MKAKLIKYGLIILGVVVVLLAMFFGIKKKYDKKAYNNAKYYKFEIEKEKTKNGQLQYTVQSLILTNKELKEVNVNLTKEIDNLNVKLKNVDNASQIEYQYVLLVDTVYVEKIIYNDTNNIYNCWYNDGYVDLSQKVIYDKTCNDLNIDSLYLRLKDTLTIVNEILYNKCIFKKPIGYKIHIKSENPYININRIETYSLLKNNRKNKKKI